MPCFCSNRRSVAICAALVSLGALAAPSHAQFVDDFNGGRDSRWTYIIPNNDNTGTVDTEQTGPKAPTQGATSLNLPIQRDSDNQTFAGSTGQANVLNLPVTSAGINDWFFEARLRYNKPVNNQYNRVNLSIFDTPNNAYSLSAKNAGFTNTLDGNGNPVNTGDGSTFFNSQVHTAGQTDPATGGSDGDSGFFLTGAAYSSLYDVRIARNNVATGYTGLFGGGYTAPAGSYTVSVNTGGTGIGAATNFAFATFASGSMFDTGGNEQIYNATRNYASDADDRGELAYLKLNSFNNRSDTLRVGITALNFTGATESVDIDRFETNLNVAPVVVIPEANAGLLSLLALPLLGGVAALHRRNAK